MKIRSNCLMLALTLLFSTAAFAHNGMNHGKPVEGTIKSVKDSSIVLSGDKGDVNVTVSADTTYVGETEDNHVAKSDMKPGVYLMVYGTKLESGEVVAKEIMIHGVHK